MSRTADYTIKGFLYQFNKTILEILESPATATITVEGPIEDIDVTTPAGTTAMQCKYHEAQEHFTASAIYKPLLQMMHHFTRTSDAGIRYILYAHFPDQAVTGHAPVAMADLQAALASNDKALRRYITEITGKIDLTAFQAALSIQFAPAYDVLVEQVYAGLSDAGIPSDDVDILAYPNAIQKIATLSMNHAVAKRTITKRAFLDHLHSIKTTAITRWTLALRTRKQLLAARRKQLKAHLDINARQRAFVVQARFIDKYNSEMVTFIQDYLQKYHSKPAHIYTPLFALQTSESIFRDLQKRLHRRGVAANDGYVGFEFDKKHFLRQPITNRAHGALHREFDLRLFRWEPPTPIPDQQTYDDIFVIGTGEACDLSCQDVNVEVLSDCSLKEIKYMIGVSHAHE